MNLGTALMLFAFRTAAMVALFIALNIFPVNSLAKTPKPTESTQPNFVILFADDLGYGDIGPFGCKSTRTPNLDRMAREGMKLTSFYAAPVCTPSPAAAAAAACVCSISAAAFMLDRRAPGGPGVRRPPGRGGIPTWDSTVGGNGGNAGTCDGGGVTAAGVPPLGGGGAASAAAGCAGGGGGSGVVGWAAWAASAPASVV